MNPYLQAAAFNLSFESQVFFNRFEKTITASQIEARFLLERDRRLAYLKRPPHRIEKSIEALKSYSFAGEFGAKLEALGHIYASIPDRIVTLFLPENFEGSEWQELAAYRESIEFFMDESSDYVMVSDGDATDSDARYSATINVEPGHPLMSVYFEMVAGSKTVPLPEIAKNPASMESFLSEGCRYASGID